MSMLKIIAKRIEQLRKDVDSYDARRLSFDERVLKELKMITLTLNLRLYNRFSRQGE